MTAAYNDRFRTYPCTVGGTVMRSCLGLMRLVKTATTDAGEAITHRCDHCGREEVKER